MCVFFSFLLSPIPRNSAPNIVQKTNHTAYKTLFLYKKKHHLSEWARLFRIFIRDFMIGNVFFCRFFSKLPVILFHHRQIVLNCKKSSGTSGHANRLRVLIFGRWKFAKQFIALFFSLFVGQLSIDIVNGNGNCDL